MLGVEHLEEEEQILRGNANGRSRLRKMVMGLCMWRVAVLTGQRREGQEDGEHDFLHK
jgi:hypothetical protein